MTDILKPMLCKHLAKVPKGKLNFPMIASEKKDGYFAHIYVDDNDTVQIVSRQGKPLIGFDWLTSIIANSNSLHKGEHIFGELYDDLIPFDIFGGWVRSFDTTYCDFLMFDYYNEDNPTTCYIDRIYIGSKIIKSSLEHIPDNLLFTVGLYTVHETWRHIDTLEQAQLMADEIIEAGGEGIVIRPVNSIYEVGKRSNNYIKIKCDCDYDCKIVKIHDSLDKDTQNPLGIAGACTVDFNGKLCRVGAGKLTHDIRADMMANQDKYIGKYVEIKAMEVTLAGQFRQGTIQRLRFDKE